MFQLFQNSLSFAFKELKSRFWFWYKLYFVVFLQSLLISVAWISLSILGVVATFRIRPYIPQNNAFIWNIILWSIVAVMIALCTFYFIKKIIQLLINLTVTSLAGAHDEKPEKISSVTTILPYAQLMYILFIIATLAMLGQKLIVIKTGSTFLGSLFLLIISLCIGIRLQFAYFILLETTAHTGSYMQLVFKSLQQRTKHLFILWHICRREQFAEMG